MLAFTHECLLIGENLQWSLFLVLGSMEVIAQFQVCINSPCFCGSHAMACRTQTHIGTS
jgi:hypothetical protein